MPVKVLSADFMHSSWQITPEVNMSLANESKPDRTVSMLTCCSEEPAAPSSILLQTMQMDLSSDDTIHSLLCDDSANQNDTQHINCVYHSHLSCYIKFLKFRPFAQIFLIKFLFFFFFHRANSICVFQRHTELCNVLFASSRFLLKSPSLCAKLHENHTKKAHQIPKLRRF